MTGRQPEAREGEAFRWLWTLRGREQCTPEPPSGMLAKWVEAQPLYTHPAAPSADKLRIAVEASSFLLDRLCDLEWDVNERDFNGHVLPAASRLRQALAALKAEGC